MKTVFLLTLATLIPLAAQAERFEAGNSPSAFKRISGTEMVFSFNQLPKNGTLLDDRYGWSETYWPSNVGGIAYRWNHPDPQPFKYKLHSKEELKSFSFQQMSQLSPAEMYDVAMGDYSYTLTKKMLGRYSTRDLWWEGICHGWAQAASNYPEPAKVLITNPDGIKVPFGSSDVKALLAMHEASNFGGAFAFTGRRCKVSGKVPGEGDDRDRNPNPPSLEDANSPDCKDVNAGGFHVVLTNMLGIHGRGFVADVDRYNDVWNQPITSYTTTIVGEEAISDLESSQGVARKVRVKTKMVYGEELQFWTKERAATGMDNFVSKEPVTRTSHQEYRSKPYEYILEIDAAGKIIGGTWVSETRVDFMWLFQRSTAFKNSPIPLGGLGKIYSPVKH
ncbi:MAG: hypothetical protein H0V66_09060 [Bdellovibrionales bacterium]|nr:hypothetical protein [Bdellovibrionales bacterium]